MPKTMNLSPFCRGLFPATDFVADRSVKNFRASTSKRAKPCPAQHFQGRPDWQLKHAFGQVPNFDRGKSLDHDIRIEGAHFAQEPQIPLLFQTGVEPADHVYLGNSEREGIANRADNLLDRELEGMRVSLSGGKGAELTRKDADVRIIDVTIVNVGCDVAVLLLADSAGHDAEGIQVLRPKHLESFGLGNALPGLDLFGNRSKIVGNER